MTDDKILIKSIKREERTGIQRICISMILSIHLAEIVMRMNSLAINARPNIDGRPKSGKTCHLSEYTLLPSASSVSDDNTGCASCATVPDTK